MDYSQDKSWKKRDRLVLELQRIKNKLRKLEEESTFPKGDDSNRRPTTRKAKKSPLVTQTRGVKTGPDSGDARGR